MPEPIWLSRAAVDALHVDQIREHGGLVGTRDENGLDSALARPQQLRTHEPDADLASLAAAYAFGLARNHPYVDGNKRIAFLALAVFLDLNGLTLSADEPDVVAVMTKVAAGELDEDGLTTWIGAHAD